MRISLPGPAQSRGRFEGHRISSDGGGLLLRESDQATGIIGQVAACFTDHRNPDLIEHAAEELMSHRIYSLPSRYEDLNDHDELRCNPLLAMLVGKRRTRSAAITQNSADIIADWRLKDKRRLIRSHR